MKLRCLVFLLTVTLSPAFAVPDIYCRDKVEVGDVFSVALYPSEGLSNVNLSLVSAKDSSRIPGKLFSARISENLAVAVALIGIPSTVNTGEYALVVQGLYEDNAFSLRRTVFVESRRFLKEDIPLNQSMTDLRAGDDPRKEEEAKHLSALLLQFDPAAAYHSGAFSYPLKEPARESSWFGDRRTYLYVDGGKAGSVHSGIDYAVPVGTPVLACGAGRVIFAGMRILSGNTVVLEHLPGVYSLYYHMDSISIKQGDVVGAGEEIGKSGMTGLVTGPHLHWEIRVGGVAVEPKAFLDRALIDKGWFLGKIYENLPVLMEGR